MRLRSRGDAVRVEPAQREHAELRMSSSRACIHTPAHGARVIYRKDRGLSMLLVKIAMGAWLVIAFVMWCYLPRGRA